MKASTGIIVLIIIIAIVALVFAATGMNKNNGTETNETNSNSTGTNVTTNSTTNQTNTSSNAVMQFETFGGFIAPAYYRHTLVVSKTGIDYTVYAQNGSVTEHNTTAISLQTYNSLLKQFTDENFTSLNNTYMPQHPNPDIGSMNISLTVNNVTKSVFIKQGFEGTPYPDSLTGIIETMQGLIPQ